MKCFAFSKSLRLIHSQSSEPSFVCSFQLIEFKLLLELGNIVLCYLDFSLRIVIKLFDLIRSDFGEFILDLFALHLIDLHSLKHESWHVDLFLTSFALLGLLCESVLEDLQDLLLLFFLAVIKTGLDR